MFDRLPALCIDLIVLSLFKQGSCRYICDIVKDCLCLTITSHETRAALAAPLAALLQPPTIYETLMASPKVHVNQLKQLCRAKGLLVSGNKKVLEQRLHTALAQTRSSTSHLGPLFCRRAHVLYECNARHVALVEAWVLYGCNVHLETQKSNAHIIGTRFDGNSIPLWFNSTDWFKHQIYMVSE